MAVLTLSTALSLACGERRLPEGDARGGDLAAGRRIYANLIDGVWRSDGTAESIEKQIRRGRDPMPAFQGKLTDEQIRQTVTYVLELTGGSRDAGR